MMNKKAVEVLPVFLLLGMMAGFSVFIINIQQDMIDHRTNPFYGGLGEREMNILAMHSQIQGDMTTLDIIAQHSFRSSFGEDAADVFIGGDCSYRNGVPVMMPGDDCLSGSGIEDIGSSAIHSFSSELYSRHISAGLPFPFNYDFHVIQDGEFFTISAYARNNVRYPIESDRFTRPGYRPSPRADSTAMAFDLSTDCHYIGDAGSASERSGMPASEFDCEGRHCRGPCPEALNPRIVPYMNQCNIPECSAGLCSIDYENICRVGCGFKSLQMAYAYYGFEFSELGRPTTANIGDLISDLRISSPDSVQEYNPSYSINPDADEIDFGVTFSNGASEVVRMLDSIRPQDYEALLDMLDEGLVRLELSGHDRNPRIDECDPNNDKGYCINRHFVLAIAGDKDHIIIHDPYTNERPYISGINLVVSREFIKDFWTGHYSHITGDAA